VAQKRKDEEQFKPEIPKDLEATGSIGETDEGEDLVEAEVGGEGVANVVAEEDEDIEDVEVEGEAELDEEGGEERNREAA
jgi:hypothetical protein